MSSGASVIALSDVAISVFTGLTILIAYFKRVKIDKHFFTFTFIFVSLAFFYMMQFGWLNFTASLRLFLKVLYAYLTIKIVGPSFLSSVEDVIGKLAIISVPLFIVQYFAPDLMMQINNLSEYIIPQVFKGPEVDYSNSIIFTVNPWGLERNSGFMWEPGAFAAMLSVAIFLNMMINQFKMNWKLGFMILAMISTQSTTGGLLLFLLGVFWFFNQKMKSIVMLAPIFVAIVAAALVFGSGTEKVQNRLANWDKTINNQDSYADDRDGISVGRFGSFVLDWNDLMSYPVIGYGLQEEERTTGRYIHLVRANGLSDYMVRFGALGLIFLLINLAKSFYRFGEHYQSRGLWIGVLIVLALSFSNPVLMSPLFLGLQFYYIATRKVIETEYAESSSSYSYVQS
jgi:hypothetical protein